MDRMVAAGRVGGLFGVKGEVSLALYDIFPREPDMEEPVFVKIDSHTVPLFFRSFRRRGQKGATAVFEDIDTEARATELVGLEFSIRSGSNGRGEFGYAENVDGEELYLEDLVGWDAEFDSGQTGRVSNYIDNEFNPLFEIKLNPSRNNGDSRGEEAGVELIPASDDFIVEVDERRRRVVFSLPEGLLGLNG